MTSSIQTVEQRNRFEAEIRKKMEKTVASLRFRHLDIEDLQQKETELQAQIDSLIGLGGPS